MRMDRSPLLKQYVMYNYICINCSIINYYNNRKFLRLTETYSS